MKIDQRTIQSAQRPRHGRKNPWRGTGSRAGTDTGSDEPWRRALACSEKTKPESGNDAGNEKSDGNLGVCLVVESFWMK
jgi:hypothetical protein